MRLRNNCQFLLAPLPSSLPNRSYAHLILPHLVYLADEPSLASLSNLLHSPLPDLLQPSLPACMVLILTGYAQQSSEDSEEGGRERRARATTSHNLLTQHLTEEVCIGEEELGGGGRKRRGKEGGGEEKGEVDLYRHWT